MVRKGIGTDTSPTIVFQFPGVRETLEASIARAYVEEEVGAIHTYVITHSAQAAELAQPPQGMEANAQSGAAHYKEHQKEALTQRPEELLGNNQGASAAHHPSWWDERALLVLYIVLSVYVCNFSVLLLLLGQVHRSLGSMIRYGGSVKVEPRHRT